MFRSVSPAQSTTSTSDNEEEDYNKSAYFASSETCLITPAQWSSGSHHLIPNPTEPPRSPASRLPPEILIHILKHLHLPRDVYHALLVSRTWCQCSVELLWHRPNFSRLSTLLKVMRVLSRHDQTFPYATFIRRLNFLSLGGELSDAVFSRLAQCVRLERLTLINCNAVSDDGLTRVLPYCPNLVALDLTGVTEVTDTSIVALASSTKKLQGINLGGCKKLTDASVLALAANCPYLRRVKLGNVELITDEAVTALAKSCPLLLEIDLNNCKLITDTSIREVWTHSTQMREMRLSYCVEVTDAAFPAPPRPEVFIAPVINPFSSSTSAVMAEKLPPLRLSSPFDHLRMLDLTACSQITDDAIEGITSVAPKIRNLVLAKCTQLTDRAVENICKLGKNLHYLHLGHASGITDRSIRCLARSCTRLRYIDLANCVELTDMSVFELSSLQKLRRIGLVRVANLTDQAVYALGERHATLERIHLSYCDQITVLAIHFLLQKLPKLTHLSLTGIPAFRRPELQQFCREPPSEFNTSQRSAFCVYSGRGVAQLRDYLMDLFTHMTEEANEADETEYEDSAYRHNHHSAYVDIPQALSHDHGRDDDDDEVAEAFLRYTNIVVSRGGHRTQVPAVAVHHVYPENRVPTPQPAMAAVDRDLAMARERTNQPVPRNGGQAGWAAGQHVPPSTAIAHPRRTRGFGQQPIVESSTSTSPAPSDVASNRSGGTNHSTGTAFFRHYTEAAVAPGTRDGVITPDLIFAEIGHGRGAEPGPSTLHVGSPTRRGTVPTMAGTSHSPYAYAPSGSTSYPATSAFRLPVVDTDAHVEIPPDSRQILVDSSNSYIHGAARADTPNGWSPGHDPASRSLSSSPTTRELQESIHSALGPQSGPYDGREVDARGRSVKRNIRSTFAAAEQYASSFFFGHRGPGGSGHDGAGPTASRDGDPRGY